MPGAFCDYIINVRTPQYSHAIMIILAVGIIFFIVYFFMTIAYYRYFAYDLIGTNRSSVIIDRIFDGVGGSNNIKKVSSVLFTLEIELEDLEKVSYDEIKRVGAKTIIETKDSLIFDFGSASTILRLRMQKALKKLSRI